VSVHLTSPTEKSSLLDVRDLCVSFETQDGRVEAVKKLSFGVAAGECLGLVGESGSGKSQTVLAAMGLTAANGVVEGSIKFEGRELAGLSRQQLNEIRGAHISMIFQDPLTSLTPHMTVGAQMAEVLARHKNLKGAAAEQRIVEWLERVRIPEARRRLHQFPHELSGGMRQRVMIAIRDAMRAQTAARGRADNGARCDGAGAGARPDDDLKRRRRRGRALITHDMGVIARMAERVVVMRHGEAVERGPWSQVFSAPKDEYTRMLLEAMPRMDRTIAAWRPAIAGAGSRRRCWRSRTFTSLSRSASWQVLWQAVELRAVMASASRCGPGRRWASSAKADAVSPRWRARVAST
jgi:peptide/nickel transport system ATP-binding protein